ncbi:MAG: oligoribonuclease [Candidatus Nanosyncoccaceae bacterium]|jgi:oligoribonuclease
MAKRDINKSKLIWLDLEMTGLDPTTDKILELALVVTDWQLQETGTLELVVKQPTEFVKKCFQASFWQEQSEVAAALLAQNENGLPLEEVEDKIIQFVQQQFSVDNPSGDIILAGNTVRVDRAFVDEYLPRFAEYLHYRTLDVSSFKVLFDARYGKIFPKAEDHRALSDIRGSIAELKYFMRFIKEK